MHGLAVGMQLPVGAGSREFLRDREHVLGRRHGIVVAMKHEYLGAHLRFREPGRLQHVHETHRAADLRIAARQVQRAQAAETESDGGDAPRIDDGHVAHRGESGVAAA